MKLVDFAQAALVALTDRILRGEGKADLDWLDANVGFGLSSERPDRMTLRFFTPAGDGVLYPAWVESARERGARRLRLVRLSDFGRELERPRGVEISDRQLAGFANTHESVLALESPARVAGLRLATWHPPRTDLTHQDVLRFMSQSPERAYFREAMLWEDEHNLHFADGKDWEALLAAVTPEREEQFVESFSRRVSNVAVSAATAERWYALREEHRTRRPGELRAIEFGSIPPREFPAPELGAVRAELKRALTGCADFAKTRKLEPWDNIFADARDALDGKAAKASELDEVFSRLYPPEAARLLSAASRGDVFGAMGSWNDLGLDSDTDYSRVSEALFRALASVLPAACASAAA